MAHLAEPLRATDMKMTGTLTIEAGDGTRIVQIAIDQSFPEVFGPEYLSRAAATVRDALHFRLEAPTRALVLAYIRKLKAARYPMGRRLDDPPEDGDWSPVDEAGRAFMDAAIGAALRHHDLDMAC